MKLLPFFALALLFVACKKKKQPAPQDSAGYTQGLADLGLNKGVRYMYVVDPLVSPDTGYVTFGALGHVDEEDPDEISSYIIDFIGNNDTATLGVTVSSSYTWVNNYPSLGQSLRNDTTIFVNKGDRISIYSKKHPTNTVPRTLFK